MPVVTYSLDNAIDKFFSEAGASSSRTECDEYARQICGGEVKPNYHQGISSYTVIAGPSSNKIVQFRDKTALLDMRSLALAKEIHPDLVSSCSELGWIGHTKGQQLAVYEMDRLPGENYITASMSFKGEQHMRTVTSLAKFFAQSWQRGMPKDPNLIDLPAVSVECHARLEYLAGALPERFIPIITQVQATLPALLDGTYPVVLTHSDLNQMNILVDPVRGNITAVVDWAGASYLPFGFTLYALEHALGKMDYVGWKWVDNVNELRNAFWSVFKQNSGISEAQMDLAKVAGKAGVLVRYGTPFDANFTGMLGVCDPDGCDLRELNAFLFEQTT